MLSRNRSGLLTQLLPNAASLTQRLPNFAGLSQDVGSYRVSMRGHCKGHYRSYFQACSSWVEEVLGKETWRHDPVGQQMAL